MNDEPLDVEFGMILSVGIVIKKPLLKYLFSGAIKLEDTGWDISRVSLKPRNKNLGIPDEWERAMLQNFDRRNKDGEITQNLEIAEYTLEADGRFFRYIKALETKPICLTCHGKVENISPQILQILQNNYPSDQATGYSVGLIRGAVSIKQSLNTD